MKFNAFLIINYSKLVFEIRRPHWRRACGNIGQLDMKLKLKVNNQVSLKGEPPFPHGPNLGPYAPLRFGYLGLGSVRFGYLRLGSVESLQNAVWHGASCNFTGNQWFRI